MLGLRRVKVKVGVDLDEDLYRLRRLRRWLGSDVDLRVDANCAWTVEQALVAIDRMRRYRISVVEQPVAAHDVDGLCRLTASCPELIAVDESLRTVEEAHALIEAGACNAFNIRVSKCGGLLSSMRIAALASGAGLTTIVGAQVGESGILSAAGRHLAACVAPRYLEGSAGALLLKEDITRRACSRAGAGEPRQGTDRDWASASATRRWAVTLVSGGDSERPSRTRRKPGGGDNDRGNERPEPHAPLAQVQQRQPLR
jgi:muconate cycloisomerase